MEMGFSLLGYCKKLITHQPYDLAIIGGGLGGLSLAILMAKKKYKVILFEKESYPFHKVCGEYISMESWDFLLSLGVPLQEMRLPLIDTLEVSAPSGQLLKHRLPLGGFGISRYLLDKTLRDIAVKNGAVIMENAKVTNTTFEGTNFTIETNQGMYTSRACTAAWGKRSNLDIKLNRPFIKHSKSRLQNYIGVKYHVKYQQDDATIALHNFQNGYCGISRIEDGKFCLCYLTTAGNLKKHGGSIPAMETDILSRNPHLAKIFTSAIKIYDDPVTISQVSFQQKTQVEDHILMVGDAAGMITPLCGNGMSMAMHAAKLASAVLDDFLLDEISREKMEEEYKRAWQSAFSRRLAIGRMIQRLFGNSSTTNGFISIMKKIPGLTTWLIRQTHGKPF